MQFSTKIDGFEQKDSQGFENSYNSYEQYPLEKFFIFTIYPNYTLALIFLTAGNLIAIGGYKMPGVWRGPRGSAPGGVKGQSPLRGPGAAPLEAIRFSQSDKVKSTQPVMHKWPS